MAQSKSSSSEKLFRFVKDADGNKFFQTAIIEDGVPKILSSVPMGTPITAAYTFEKEEALSGTGKA